MSHADGRASGKTSFYRRHFQRYEHINQDTLGTRDRCLAAATTQLKAGKSVVIGRSKEGALI
jgi:bifunctional polynucleotide phosphatase/kinase